VTTFDDEPVTFDDEPVSFGEGAGMWNDLEVFDGITDEFYIDEDLPAGWYRYRVANDDGLDDFTGWVEVQVPAGTEGALRGPNGGLLRGPNGGLLRLAS
jgi:hypothetical protein